MSGIVMKSVGANEHPNLSLRASPTKVREAQSLFPQTVWSFMQKFRGEKSLFRSQPRGTEFCWNSAKHGGTMLQKLTSAILGGGTLPGHPISTVHLGTCWVWNEGVREVQFWKSKNLIKSQLGVREYEEIQNSTLSVYQSCYIGGHLTKRQYLQYRLEVTYPV